MKISDLDKLKFTSIKYGGDIIHFKYDNEHYTLENGGREMTAVIQLYKGRTKYNLEYITGKYGLIYNLIIYKNNKRTLSSIDKENFVKKLVEYNILEPTKEQRQIIINKKIEELECTKNRIQEQIDYFKSEVE